MNDEIIKCQSVKVEKILDLTGAGDLFAAGFLKEYLDHSDIRKSLKCGSELASKIIQKMGARLGLANLSEMNSACYQYHDTFAKSIPL